MQYNTTKGSHQAARHRASMPWNYHQPQTAPWKNAPQAAPWDATTSLPPPPPQQEQQIVPNHPDANKSPQTSDELFTKWAISVLSSSTRAVLSLQKIVQQRTNSARLVASRRKNVFKKLDQLCLRALRAADLVTIFQAIDQEFFCGAICKVFSQWGHHILFSVQGDSVMSTHAGVFSKRGVVHFITICHDLFRRMQAMTESTFSVCGIPCPDPLTALVVVMEHEICHLLVACNWPECTQPHGPEFAATSFGIFRHTEETHRLPVCQSHPPNAAELLFEDSLSNDSTSGFQNHHQLLPPCVYPRIQETDFNEAEFLLPTQEKEETIGNITFQHYSAPILVLPNREFR